MTDSSFDRVVQALARPLCRPCIVRHTHLSITSVDIAIRNLVNSGAATASDGRCSSCAHLARVYETGRRPPLVSVT